MKWLNRLINRKEVPITTSLATGTPIPEEVPQAVSNIPEHKSGIHKKWVLSEEEKVEVCRKWASYETMSRISKWLEEERGKKISIQAIYSILKTEKWVPLIEQQRNQFIQGLIEEPLSNKRKRLQYLQHYMEKAEAKGNYLISINAVDKARLEMEPKNENFQLQLNQFNMISDEELKEIRNRLQEKLKRKEVIHVK